MCVNHRVSEKKEEENDLYLQIKHVLDEVMKQIYYVVFVIIAISIPFLLSIFLKNYTATAIGVVLIGMAGQIIMFDMGAKSRAMIYMWVAIIFIISALLGIEYLIPKITIE